MSSAVIDRLRCLKAVLARSKELEHLELRDGIKSIFKWYGFSRRSITTRLKITPVDSQLDWIDVGVYGIAWPKGRPLSRLVGALIEQWAPSNSHFYFSKPTEIREGDYVVDVGATEGSFGVECLIKYKAANVWCFEPDLSMNLALKETVERNHLADRLHIVSAAVTKTSGTMHFLENAADPLASYCVDYVSEMEAENHSNILTTVPGISLDDWASQTGIERIDYIKIDAEGSDLAVLQGARNCLERWRPSLAVTTYHHPDHCNEMIEYLSSLGLGYHFRVKGVISFDSVPRPVMLHAASRE